MDVTTRPSEETDRAFALEAHHLAYHDVVIRQFGRWDEQEQDQFFQKSWVSTEHLIILLNGQRCGYTSLEHLKDYTHVRELVIHPTFQGQGIGSTFLGSVCSTAAERGTTVKLGVFLKNTAIEFYKRLGFQEFDKTDTHLLMEWRPPEKK